MFRQQEYEVSEREKVICVKLQQNLKQHRNTNQHIKTYHEVLLVSTCSWR